SMVSVCSCWSPSICVRACQENSATARSVTANPASKPPVGDCGVMIGMIRDLAAIPFGAADKIMQGNMRRRTFFSVCAAGAVTSGCQRSNKRVIGVAPKGTSSIFWQSIYAGVKAAAKDFDVEILWNGPPNETDYARQIQIVEAMINRGVNGIVLS